MANVPSRKERKDEVTWDGYSDRVDIVYQALVENDNYEAKPRQPGERTDNRMGKALAIGERISIYWGDLIAM